MENPCIIIISTIIIIIIFMIIIIGPLKWLTNGVPLILSKAVIKGVLSSHTVSMVTYCVSKLITTC